jgi:sortase A
MLKKLGFIQLAIGFLMMSYVIYLVFDFYRSSENHLYQAESYLEKDRIANLPEAEAMSIARENFAPELGQAIGKIEIPSINLRLPIVAGSEQAQLKLGVGHIPETWFPGDGNQIFLTGHNDSAFTNIGKLKEGDIIKVSMPYGTFEYVFNYSEIGHESEVGRIGSMDEETLVLMTCYPFFSLIPVEKRYFVYAVPVN